MTNKKTDTFSRIVAFITAFAVAMLTVTLIHRTVISAEEALPEMTEASDTADGSGESMPSEIASEDSVSSDTDNTVSIAETQEEFYEDTAAPPDNGSLEAEPLFPDLNADFNGIELYADTNDEHVSLNKTCVLANSIIIPDTESLKIYKGNSKIELSENEKVNNGDGLEFFFKWEISDDDKTDYSHSYFKYDITDSLKGVTLTPHTYPYWVGSELKAVYEIINEPDPNPETSKPRTIMLIEPRSGFEANSKGRGGSIHLEGAVRLEDFPVGNPIVKLKFLDKTVTVNAPSLDNSIFPSKRCNGNPEKRTESDGVNYYQKYVIDLQNKSDYAANSVTALDIPGSMFVGEPQNAYVWYDNYLAKEPLSVTKGSEGGYVFSVDNIPAKSYAHIEYEMKIDTGKAVNPLITTEERKNTVKVTSNKNPDASPAESFSNVYDIIPHVEKSGVIDKERNVITWTIKVKSNGLQDDNFTVIDTIDENLTLPGNNWDKTAFTDKGNGIWEMSYDTAIPDNVNNATSFKNKAEVKFDDYPGYVYTGESSVTYQYDVSNMVQKECTGLNAADGTIGWTITANIPEHNNKNISSIVIKDWENTDYSQYNKESAWYWLLKYDTESFTMQIDDGEEQAIGTSNLQIDRKYDYITGDNIVSGFTLTFNDEDFLRNIVGKKITINYKTTASSDKYYIGKVSYLRNDVECYVTYGEEAPLNDKAYAEYKNEPVEPFILNKNEYKGNNLSIEGVTKVEPNMLREYIPWEFNISDIKNLDPTKENVIKFTDTAPEGYTFNTKNIDEYPVSFVASEIPGSTLDVYKLATTVEFNEDYTVMNGTITLTDAQVEYIKKNNNSRIWVAYYTQMTEKQQVEFLTNGEKKTFTNTVSVSVNDSPRIEATHSVEKVPDQTSILEKESKPIGDTRFADYTINVNSKKLHLGDEETKVITLTDRLGKYLKLKKDQNDRYELKITPDDGTNIFYDEDKGEMKFTLKNDTAYTITYTAEVITQLASDECIAVDEDDKERNDGIIKNLYGNTAELSILDNSAVEARHLIAEKIYRSSVSIQSKLKDSSIDNTEDKMCLKVKKLWNDPEGSNVIHDMPITLIVAKYYAKDKNNKDATPINEQPYTIRPYKNEYYINITDLPTKDNKGNEYFYKVIGETDAPENYICEFPCEMKEATGNDIVTGYANNTYVITVTNTYSDSQEKMKLTVKKEWQGDTDNTKYRDKSIGFSIKQGDIEGYITGTLNAPSWTQTFEVPKYSDDAKKIPYVYTVSETTDNPYYKSSVTSKTDSDGKGVTYTITNTYITPIKLTVQKVWEKDAGHTDLRSGSVNFSIEQKNGKKDYLTGTLNATKWTQTFTVPSCSNDGKDTPYEYIVTETTDNKYYDSSVTSKTDSDGKGVTYTITNTFIPRKQINLTVKKVWDKDGGYTDLRSDSVDILITRDGNDYMTVTLNAANGWEKTLTVPQCSDAEQTKNFKYEVKEETKNNNYIPSILKETSENADGSITFTVTNTFDPVDITVKKIWDDRGNEDKRENVTFTLLRNNIVYGEYTIPKDGNLTYVIKNLPQYDKSGVRYNYTITEKKINDYDITDLKYPNNGNSYNASITNKYAPDIDLDQKITIKVTKHWSDKGHEDERSDVTFELLRNGKKYGKTHTISKSGKTGDNWMYTIDDELPKYDAGGVAYKYEVKEDASSRYDVNITQPEENNFYNAVINNTYKPPKTIDISVTKTWDDGGYKYMRPDITLKLMQGETEYDRYTIHAADNVTNNTWTYTFKNVPECDKDGNPYLYSVKEEIADENAAKSYDVFITGSGSSWSIKNKYKVPIKDPDESTQPEKDPTTIDPVTTDTTASVTEPASTTSSVTEPTGTTPSVTEPTGTVPSATDPASTASTVTGSVNPTLPAVTEPPVTTAPMADGIVIPIGGSTTSTSSEESDPTAEPEDVSAKAGIFDDEFDAVRRDDIIILILTVIIITGTLILVFRHNSNKSDGKYRM